MPFHFRLLFFALSFSITLWASSPKPSCETLLGANTQATTEVFQKAFQDPTIYQQAECAENVARFLRRLKSKHIPFENAEVWYLTGSAGMVVHHARNPFAEWGYHVILVSDGIVYDFDYQTEPTPLPIRPYIESNVSDGNPQILSSVSVLSLPATVFERHFPKSDSDADYDRFVKFLKENYSFTSLRERMELI